MVDKVIGELPSISSLDDESLFVAEQNGQAVKVSGKQLTDFSNVETTAQVEQAKASAQAAKTAQDAAEAAILKSPIIQNGRLVGAVTHVFVNDPTSGYGVSIEDMLRVAQHVS